MPKSKSRNLNSQSEQNGLMPGESFPRFKRSLLAAAIMSCTTAVMAQEAVDENKESEDDSAVEVISVTGQRQSLESAIDLKKNADTIGDSIVLDEAGKVPSTSLLEILERSPGVTMNRVRAGSEGSPDGFAFEGSGIQVRGPSSNFATLQIQGASYNV